MKNLPCTSWRTGQVLLYCGPLTFLLQGLNLWTGISLILSSVLRDTNGSVSFSFSHQEARWACYCHVFWWWEGNCCWEHLGRVWGERLLLYLPLDGGREGGKGTAQYLFLIWHLTGFWYDSSSLEVLSHAVGLSLLGNSFVAPRELNCLGTVQLKHRVTRGQGTTELAPVLGHWVARSNWSSWEGLALSWPCLAAAVC